MFNKLKIALSILEIFLVSIMFANNILMSLDFNTLTTKGVVNGRGKFANTEYMVFDKANSIEIVQDETTYKVKGCEAVTTVEGKEDYDNIQIVKIDGVEYKYLLGMTWADWAHSKYNTIGEPHFAPAGLSFTGRGDFIAYNTSFVIRNSDTSIDCVTVQENHQIIVGEEYHFDNSSPGYGGIDNTTSYYIIDSWDDYITYDIKKQQIDW